MPSEEIHTELIKFTVGEADEGLVSFGVADVILFLPLSTARELGTQLIASAERIAARGPRPDAPDRVSAVVM